MAEDHIIHLAADDTTLYALAGRTEKDSDTGYNVATSKTLYSSSDGGLTWKAVELKDAEGNAITMNLQATAAFTAKLFCTNAPQKAHRKAYIRISNITIYPYYSYVFELSGGTATRLETGTADLASTPTITTQSCAYFNGKTYFSSNAAITTDETLTTEAAHIYNGSSTIVQYSKDPEAETNPWTTTISTSTIYSLAYTKTHLLIGTADGLIYVTLDSTDSENTNLPKEKASITNASSTLSSYYRVFNVIAADPSAGALGCDIYASSVFSGSPSSTGASSDNIGLWAYYPGRANWNRE
ncbi:MAG: hypothetical protein IJS09_08805 [Treponema sp.]|nr:hypothetical protein [Treponema sp.]